MSMRGFSEPARRWFRSRFPAPTPVQRLGWERIAAGEHALLVAPTGSGKTLAAFFWCIDRLAQAPAGAPAGVRALYVSPLKALVYDVERNLRAPLAGLAGAAAGELRIPRVAVRTGDTPERERRQQARDPAEILVTTPESLYLVLGSRQRETLASVETVIVDEVHALAGNKRGAHLALSLERLAALARRDPQRIGLSATARPLPEIARFLGGDRPVAIVDAAAPPALELEVVVPVADMARPEGPEPQAGIWPAIYPRLLEQIRAHTSTIVFTNSRALCERMSQRLNELAGEPIARAHHGSLAHAKRREIEEQLKAGELRALVATSSLELGIDMGAVDLVLLVESPGSVARGLQRVGRAGHRVGQTSAGRIFPRHRGDLLEAAVVVRGMLDGRVEALELPANPLDVLAQQLVALCAERARSLGELEALVRRAANFRELERDALVGVLDMLAGRFPSTDFAELRARIVWDREHDRLVARSGAGRLALASGGTIPDRGLYAVHLGESGPRIGELDEEMVHETRPGEAITLGASTWRVERITRDRVVVAPAPGEIGRLPFWRGEGPGRPLELGCALGAFLRELETKAPDEAEAWLRRDFRLDPLAARNLLDYLAEQRAATGRVPDDRRIVIERFRDELGDWRMCILSPFGARIHAPWALAIEAELAERGHAGVQALSSDDGIVLRLADADALPGRDALVPDAELVEERVIEQLAGSALFASQFRENAARALLLPRRRPGARTPLWVQRLRAQNLLAVARRFPSFPIVLETYRSCLHDVFDVPGLVALLAAIRGRQVDVVEVETRSASPFARSLVFAYTAAYLYQGDTPAAERRVGALTLDRNLLRGLLGQKEQRELLDAAVVADTEAWLQGLEAELRARSADAVHDLLRRVGDLDAGELAARADEDPAPWLAALARDGRALVLSIAGAERWVAAEDAALYRDALGATLPAGLPAALLAPAERPLEQLLLRFARTHGPFEAARVVRRFRLAPAEVDAALRGLEARDRLVSGALLPGGSGQEWCDPEVLRRLRRRTLAKLRSEVAPVEASVLARFLPRWHGIGQAGDPAQRLHRALAQLEGAALSFAELERAILPARVPGFDPRLLDERGAQGQLVWIGRGALGERDGRIALFRRERAPLLVDPPETPAGLGPLESAILTRLEERGASFFAELSSACGAPPIGEMLDALWSLVWAGLVTNDTFAPLRALSARRQIARGRRSPGALAGRWSLVRAVLAGGADAAAQAQARAQMLLDRYGVLSRDAVAAEALPGGYAALYPLLRALEEAGRVRRGHFVEGLGGAQFALADAVEALRAARSPDGAAEAAASCVLAASDPANPFGVLLPWPASRLGAAGAPRRAAGATLVIEGGEPLLYLDRGGARAVSFAGASDAGRALRAVRALARLFGDRRRAMVRIEEIDGQPARASSLAPTFVQAGFRADYKGLVLERARPLAPGSLAQADA
jgi:ATP-dependent Lhr-like helicase